MMLTTEENMRNPALENRLVKFLRTLTGQASIQGDTDLLESGIVDSLTTMDLLVFIETEVGVRLAVTDLTPETFRTARKFAAHLSKMLNTPRPARPEAA